MEKLDQKPTSTALIVAAGRGLRAGGDGPKQWQNLAGIPIARRTALKFLNHPQISEVVIVIHDDDQDIAASVFDGLDIKFAIGGATRSASVLNGLRALQSSAPDMVLIHDAARPNVSAKQINDVTTALTSFVGAAPALVVTDALWIASDAIVSGTQDRSNLFRAQTPQGFHFDAILKAHENHQGPAADDVEVARAAGLDVAIVAGDEANLKITMPDDFARATQLLETPMDIRTGNGFDVHRFGDGDHVILCGVTVPHGRSLQGHSDADVGMHAVTDALYGALGEGDIGQHFPPSDPQWKGAASEIFLKHAVDLAHKKGFEISNMDCTLICEFPKIGPHQGPMKAKMADLMGMDVDRVSVKATTSERLGFTGREEGIAALATVTLVAQ